MTMIKKIKNFFKKLHDDIMRVRNHDDIMRARNRTVVGPWFM